MVNYLKKINLPKIGLKIKSNQVAIILCLVILLALFWRVWQINVFPKNLSTVELNQLEKISALIKNGWHSQPADIFNALYLYLFAALGRISDFNILFLRIFQALIGTATVAVFYFFTKEWFNRQIALLSTLFLATNAFHLAVSREIEPTILIPLVIILIPYLLTLAFRTSNRRWFILCGLISGLSLYVDNIFIFLPLIYIILSGYFLNRNPRLFTRFWSRFLLFTLVFLVVAAPFVYFLPQNFNHLVEFFNPGSFGRYFMNLGANVQSLLYQSIPGTLYYVGLEPILSPFLAVTFLAGLVYTLFYFDRRQYYFLIILFVFLLAIISLSNIQTPLNYIAVLPLTFVFSSIILNYFLKNWLKTFPLNQSAKIFLTFILSLFIFLTVYYNYEKYFLAWGQNEAIQTQFNQKFDYNKEGK